MKGVPEFIKLGSLVYEATVLEHALVVQYVVRQDVDHNA